MFVNNRSRLRCPSYVTIIARSSSFLRIKQFLVNLVSIRIWVCFLRCILISILTPHGFRSWLGQDFFFQASSRLFCQDSHSQWFYKKNTVKIYNDFAMIRRKTFTKIFGDRDCLTTRTPCHAQLLTSNWGSHINSNSLM